MRGEDFRKGMEKLGRLTLSKLYLQGKTSVDVDVSEYVLDKMKEDQRQATDKIKKMFATYTKLEYEVSRIRNIDVSKKKNGQYTGKELGVLL